MSQTKIPTASPYHSGNDDATAYAEDGEPWTGDQIGRVINDIDALKNRLGVSVADSAFAPFWGGFATLADRLNALVGQIV